MNFFYLSFSQTIFTQNTSLCPQKYQFAIGRFYKEVTIKMLTKKPFTTKYNQTCRKHMLVRECEVRNYCPQIQMLNVLIKSPTCHGKLLDGLREMRNFEIGPADEAVLQAKRFQSWAKSAQLFQILRRQVFL
jgi:hypothetical protein